MLCSEINIRDPFVLSQGGVYYLYGTRAKNFGTQTGGFDVYTSTDLVNWSEPVPCFDSAKFGRNGGVNWAPEVYAYHGGYYMFATFTREDGQHATYALQANDPAGSFVPHSETSLTPQDWECLDGTLYVSPDGTPYLVFCHEHSQISDGTICYTRLTHDKDKTVLKG